VVAVGFVDVDRAVGVPSACPTQVVPERGHARERTVVTEQEANAPLLVA
jgi:hypothetical protein